MDDTAITLKFSEQEFAELQDTFYAIICKLNAIGHIDLRSISDDVSFGHYLLIGDVSERFDSVLKQLETAVTTEK